MREAGKGLRADSGQEGRQQADSMGAQCLTCPTSIEAENRVGIEQVAGCCEYTLGAEPKVLEGVHTRGWKTAGNRALRKMALVSTGNPLLSAPPPT